MVDILLNTTRIVGRSPFKDLPSKWYPWRILTLKTPRIFIIRGNKKTYLFSAPTKLGLTVRDDGYTFEFMIVGFGLTYSKHTGY